MTHMNMEDKKWKKSIEKNVSKKVITNLKWNFFKLYTISACLNVYFIIIYHIWSRFLIGCIFEKINQSLQTKYKLKITNLGKVWSFNTKRMELTNFYPEMSPPALGRFPALSMNNASLSLLLSPMAVQHNQCIPSDQSIQPCSAYSYSYKEIYTV